MRSMIFIRPSLIPAEVCIYTANQRDIRKGHQASFGGKDQVLLEAL